MKKLTLSEFISAYRIAYCIPFLMACITGLVPALQINHLWISSIIIFIEIFLFAMFVNLSNDYFDYKSGIDKLKFKKDNELQEKLYGKVLNETVYWKGNAIDIGYISQKQLKIVLFIIAGLLLILSIPLIINLGYIVLILGLSGFFLSFFYTAPPLSLSSKGLGEVDVFLSFSMISFFSYYVQVQEFNLLVLLLSLVVGLGTFIMRFVDEMTGFEAHKIIGEKDISVRLGIKKSIKIVKILIVVLYILSIVISIINPWFALLFLTLPLPVKIFKIYNSKDELKVYKIVPLMFKLNFLMPLLIIISWIMQSVL
ncbi:MAG: prenyltransferase [Bacteroidales bacterium]|nr:prenyltransferase [Bacteroidales bacterium]